MDIKKFNLFDFHNTFDKHIQVSYRGPFDKTILSVMGKYIEVILVSNPKVSKKVFKIFIELAQNISYYSAEVNALAGRDSGVGTLVIAEFEDYFLFMAGNKVKNESIIEIIDKCEVINSLDRDSLRKYKREQRSLPQGPRGGAHIGLIQVALTSANPLDFEVNPVDREHSFFSITVKIDK